MLAAPRHEHPSISWSSAMADFPRTAVRRRGEGARTKCLVAGSKESPPHAAHARAQVDACIGVRPRGGRARRRRPRYPIEQPEQLGRNEARARRLDVAVALLALAAGEEALPHHAVEPVLAPRPR